MLSIEESGKACLAHWTKDGHLPSSDAASLPPKQRIFGTYRKLKAINSVGKVVEKKDAGDYDHEPCLVKVLARALDEHARLPVAKADFGCWIISSRPASTLISMRGSKSWSPA